VTKREVSAEKKGQRSPKWGGPSKGLGRHKEKLGNFSYYKKRGGTEKMVMAELKDVKESRRVK